MKFTTLVRATVACALASSALVHAATPDQWRSRSIYQVLTDRFARGDGSTSATCNTGDRKYCGGTYQGIIKKLDYIQNMGFTAIWISPITYNIPDQTPYGYAYHGYWQQDLYRLNENYGTADDLKALSKALHDRGMYLMVDIVVNHNGWNGAASTVDYSKFKPFNDPKYYHLPYCTISDYNNQANVENCWLGDEKVELPDIKTEDSTVASMYQSWIKGLVSNYSIDGLRIDTVKHVPKSFWPSFNQAAGVFSTGEVFNGDPAYTCDYQQSLDSVLNYPLYYPILNFLTAGKPASRLTDGISQVKASCKDATLLGTFTENHDLPRFASKTNSVALAKTALALTILLDGIPIVYAGQEQHYAGGDDPNNREATWLSGYNTNFDLYKFTAAINQVRNHAAYIDAGYLKYNAWAVWSDSRTVALRKGSDGKQIITVVTNAGENGGSWTQSVGNTGWASGTQVVEILTCVRSTVGGTLSVPMSGGVPRVYVTVDSAKGSGICSL